MTRRPILILVAGDPVPPVQASHGGFAQLIRRASHDAWDGDWLVADLRAGESLPDGRTLAGVVISGSPDSLTARTSWMNDGLTYVRQLVRVGTPTLGICFGHQMLGEALGGRVLANPRGREIGSVTLTVTKPDPVLGEVSGALPTVNMTHLDSVVELPAGARVLATTALEPHAAVQFAPQAWGVQFHPEMDAEIIRAYISYRREALESEGLNASQLIAVANDAPQGGMALRRFLEHVACRD